MEETSTDDASSRPCVNHHEIMKCYREGDGNG